MKTAAPTYRQPWDLKGGDSIKLGDVWAEVFDTEYGRNGWWSIQIIDPERGNITRTATNQPLLTR